MARGINKVILIGNLGQAPEVHTMPSGGAVANVTLATSEAWTDKKQVSRLNVLNGIAWCFLIVWPKSLASI